MSWVGPLVWGALSPAGSIHVSAPHPGAAGKPRAASTPHASCISACPAWLYSLVLHVVGNMAAVTPDSPLFKVGVPTYCFPAPVQSAREESWLTQPGGQTQGRGSRGQGAGILHPARGQSIPSSPQSGRQGGRAAPQSHRGAVARRRKKDAGQTKPANVQHMNFLSGNETPKYKGCNMAPSKGKRKSGCLGLRARCWKFFGSLFCSAVCSVVVFQKVRGPGTCGWFPSSRVVPST